MRRSSGRRSRTTGSTGDDRARSMADRTSSRRSPKAASTFSLHARKLPSTGIVAPFTASKRSASPPSSARMTPATSRSRSSACSTLRRRPAPSRRCRARRKLVSRTPRRSPPGAPASPCSLTRPSSRISAVPDLEGERAGGRAPRTVRHPGGAARVGARVEDAVEAQVVQRTLEDPHLLPEVVAERSVHARVGANGEAQQAGHVARREVRCEHELRELAAAVSLRRAPGPRRLAQRVEELVLRLPHRYPHTCPPPGAAALTSTS